MPEMQFFRGPEGNLDQLNQETQENIFNALYHIKHDELKSGVLDAARKSRQGGWKILLGSLINEQNQPALIDLPQEILGNLQESLNKQLSGMNKNLDSSLDPETRQKIQAEVTWLEKAIKVLSDISNNQ